MVLVKPEQSKGTDAGTGITLRTPKRILHFSDGILEEYSDDEVDTTPKSQTQVVDPASLTWGPWMWFQAWRAGSGTLSALDTMGEFLASFFGITTPKYYFELEEYKRREEQKKKDKEDAQGWCEPADPKSVMLKDITSEPQLQVVTSPPEPVSV